MKCFENFKVLRLRLMGVLKIDKKLQDQLFAEIQDSLSAELNYEIFKSLSQASSTPGYCTLTTTCSPLGKTAL
jgi:hypothetical protein